MNKISGKIINHNKSFLGEVIFDDKIKEVNKLTSLDIDQYIIPGFIDLHCHGGNGFDTMEGSKSIENLSKFHLNKGTTTLLPTTMTGTFDKTFKALKDFNLNFKNNNKKNILGVHLEGPFINNKKLGAQPNYAIEPSFEFVEEISKIADIKIVTLAPELDGADKLIDSLIKSKINVQIGHSLAEYKCCREIMKEYPIGFTHLYNAMSGNDHRNPGVLTAALSHSKYAEIICDFNHVSEPAIKIAKKCIERLYAVTDAIGATGLDNGFYDFIDMAIEKKDNVAVLKNSSTLAGSVIDMHTTFINLLQINFSLEEAVAMTSYNAAQYINEKKLGHIEENLISNFLVLDSFFKIKEIYLNGRKINT